MIEIETLKVSSGLFKSPWKYIIVDEFQDISRGRYFLIKALQNQVKRAKTYCVGDDWQAINRFAGADKGYAITTPMYRDTASWYHLQVVLDTNNATAGDRIIIYVNGERVTAFDNNPTITQNAGSTINDGYEHRIGRGNNTSGSSYFDGNMTHVHFVDGQAPQVSDFFYQASVTTTFLYTAEVHDEITFDLRFDYVNTAGYVYGHWPANSMYRETFIQAHKVA